jgi:putative transposase
MDLICRDFSVNTRRCGDIPYLPTWEGWLYLATMIDIASRRVVGFALAEHLRTELVADALTNAFAARDPAPGVVFHSDMGHQYASGDYAALAEDLALKGECLDQQPWPTRAAARRVTGSTSPGTTALGCTAPWATWPLTSSRPPPTRRSSPR